MQKLANCEFIINIERIEHLFIEGLRLEIVFSTTDKKRHKFIFDGVLDIRCSIENASIDRFCEFRKCLTGGIIDNSVYVVEDSEYIKYFEHQVSGTHSIDELNHYIVSDNLDTIVDILVDRKKPTIIPHD